MTRIASSLMALLAVGYGSHRIHVDSYRYFNEQDRDRIVSQALDARYQAYRAAVQPEEAPAANVKSAPAAPTANTNAVTAAASDIAPATRLPRINKVERQRYAPLIQRVARRYNLEAALLHAIISAESAYDPYAISARGASGLMQLMPDTADQYGVVDIYDPSENVVAGAKHLRYLLGLFDNNIALAIAAYNAGHNTVIRYGHAIPPFRQTLDYVPRVLGYYEKYQQGI